MTADEQLDRLAADIEAAWEEHGGALIDYVLTNPKSKAVVDKLIATLVERLPEPEQSMLSALVEAEMEASA